MKTILFLCAIAAASALREPTEKTCTEKPETGPCRAYFPMYYYDPETGTCKSFIYGGCQGNGNRYSTEESCLENCAALLDETVEPYWFRRRNKRRAKKYQSVSQAAVDTYDCDKAPETGLCDAYFPRFYYDQETGECKIFVYGGCGGNKNNFRTRDECYKKCGALRTPSVCDQEKEVGLCKGAFPRYYYNKETDECERFIYGGCAGNDNNFHRKEVCEAVCVAARSPSKCNFPPETGKCRGYFPRYYYDPEKKTCESFIYGGCEGNENNFETQGECLDECSE